jgi:hypothetical protein
MNKACNWTWKRKVSAFIVLTTVILLAVLFGRRDFTGNTLIIYMGLISSVFYGFGAVDIFQRAEPRGTIKRHLDTNVVWTEEDGEPRWQPYPRYTSPWWIHQVSVNFLGSAVGWFFVLLLYSKFHATLIVPMLHGAPLTDFKPDRSDLVYFAIAMLGVMGFLTDTVFGIMNSARLMVDRYLK